MSTHGAIKQGGIGEEPLKASTAEDVFIPEKTLISSRSQSRRYINQAFFAESFFRGLYLS